MEIKSFNLGHRPTGEHSQTWNGKDEKGKPVSSGIYLYTLKSGGEIDTRKMTVLK
jgi:flagellar hook assembly protein FlgD